MSPPPAARFAALAAASLLAGALAGCSAAPPNPQPPPVTTASPAAPAQGTDFSKLRWRAYDSLAQGFAMPLPEDLAWRIEDRADTWLVAKHAPTSTQIVARLFTLDALANRARCEAHARDLRALPDREGAVVLEKRRVDLPSGFDTILEVGLLPTAPGQPIAGYVLAFGGWAKKCFAYALTTSAKGVGAEEAVGDRLALFVEESFLHLRFGSDLTPTVPREKLPKLP